MHPVLVQLQKVLSLEIKDGYPNRAVIGGLPKALVFWEPSARRAGLDPQFIDAIAERLNAYPALSVTERAQAIETMLGMIRQAAQGRQAVASAPVESLPAVTEAAAPVSLPPTPTPPPPPSAPQTVSAVSAEARLAPPAAEEVSVKASRRSSGAQLLKSAVPVDASAGLDAPLTVLAGVGPANARRYRRLGLNTVGDLLTYFPRRYDNYSSLKTINRLEYGEECTVLGTIVEAEARRSKDGRRFLLKVVLSDTTGRIEMTFFNQPWLADKLTVGRQVVVAGRVDQYLGRLVLAPEEWEYLDRELLNTGRIVPVYRRTEGITQHQLRKLMAQVVQYWARRQSDHLPAEIRDEYGLMTYGEALAQIHYPDDEAALAAARQRLAFDELFLLQLGILRRRRRWQSAGGMPLAVADEWLQRVTAALPYALTAAQQRAFGEIRADMAREVPMNRLLQGDVGSGKTVVAAVAMALAAAAGAQAALMAPTAILAEQHYRTIMTLFPPDSGLLRGACRLLQGGTPAAEKDEIYAGLRSGEITVVVGTHALLETPVEFACLGLVVVDEQHRFGVTQRAALRSKGVNPHLLAMTATPIPRSLALTVYGDLDLSVLDELPPGRQPVKTILLRSTERERGYAFIRAQIKKGRQAFIVFPLVEESEHFEVGAAVDEHRRLQAEVFPEFRLGLVHGRLPPDEKEAVMAAFRAGEYHILVATSVVEVGVDVPNATVMLVEGADRFGLAQLHQFRGRVGRGEHGAYCLLISDSSNPRSLERLTVLEQSQDGFYLAEKDLEMRGPGDFLGVRQSGFANLRLARLSDVATIAKARQAAQALFTRDPDLQAPEHRALAARLERFWMPGTGEVS